MHAVVSLLHFPTIYASQQKYRSMLGKVPIYRLSRSKAPKTQQIYRHKTKTSGLFLLYSTGVNFSSRDNFANWGSLAKVSVPVQFIIPWLYVWAFQSCLHLAVCEEIDKLGGAYFFSNMPLRCSYPQLITLDIIAKRLDIYPPIWYDIVIYCHGMWIQHTNAYSFQWTGVGWHDCFSMTLHTIV